VQNGQPKPNPRRKRKALSGLVETGLEIELTVEGVVSSHYGAREHRPSTPVV